MEYTYTEERLSNGNTIKYKITPDGTAYHQDTPDALVAILERLRENKTRVRIYLGDSKTGQDWEEQFDVFGTIGRSTGRIKIPLMVANSRSMGGGGLLDDCIVKIEYANKKQGGVIWQHPKYYRGDDPMYDRSHYRKKLSSGVYVGKVMKKKTSRIKKSTKKQSPSGFGGTR
jgi:hypothetical protein